MCVLSLAHFLRKLQAPDTSSCLTSSPSIHIKPVPQVHYPISSRSDCSIQPATHDILSFILRMARIASYPNSLFHENITNRYWCSFPSRLARTSEFFSTQNLRQPIEALGLAIKALGLASGRNLVAISDRFPYIVIWNFWMCCFLSSTELLSWGQG